MRDFRKGQRWISESEPELGIGVVVDVKAGSVFVLFPASATLRQYASASAPIKRVEFRPGDSIKTHEGEVLIVESITTGADGVLSYHGAGRVVPETDLSDTLSFCKPEERLFAGQVDKNATFDLRLEALRRRHQIRSSPVRGMLGARIDLIPHQLFIAHEVASRALPRVLLADEVGLGKTIEACLVVHRLYRSGRAGRILVLVPEPLVHQWFVELLRRFNLLASIYDEERCDAIETGDPEANPFLDSQLVLCPISLLAGNNERGAQCVAAGWDLVVIDEAHHLAWSPEESSPEYEIASKLAAISPGLILLTATPEQLGAEGHFARLRLLDPNRYDDFATFEKESGDYQKTAKLAGKLLDEKPLTAADLKTLRALCKANPERLETHLAALKTGDSASREAIVQELIDQHGTGRVMFRNTRSAMKGFPKRKVHLIELEAADLSSEWTTDETSGARSYKLKDDPRVKWLVTFLGKMKQSKVLLICRTQEKALALEEALRNKVNVKLGLFHEGLTLLQRDRNAAWFAEEDGAQLLLCSEIGSEGRNFQFAHHLVLFDLPSNPELLEQRIGRLDRIGQTQTIAIHVPIPSGSHLEVLARWFHEGMNAFEKSLEGGRALVSKFGKTLQSLIAEPSETKLVQLIEETKTLHGKLVKELEQGQDRLLQLNSCRAEVAKELVEAIAKWDQDRGVDEFMLRMFEHFGVNIEDIADRSWLAIPADLTTDAFPDMPPEGLMLTADRTRALSREEVGFLTWDHPLVTGALDLLLASEQGNSCFAIWDTKGDPAVFVESIFVLEPIAPPTLHADRFLPPTPIRVVTNGKGENVSVDVQPKPEELSEGAIFKLLDNPRVKQRLIPSMIEKSREHATERAKNYIEAALRETNSVLKKEIERLRDLQKVNDHIREEEITTLETQLAELEARIKGAPIRLDSIRLLWRPG